MLSFISSYFGRKRISGEFFFNNDERRRLLLKKLIASAMLTGLLLSTTIPVFAEEGTNTHNGEGTFEHTTDLSSTLEAEYTIKIPTELSIDLKKDGSSESIHAEFGLTDINTAGHVEVLINDPGNLTLKGNENEKIEVNLSVQSVDQSYWSTYYKGNAGSTISLSNNAEHPALRKIKMSTTEKSIHKLAGTYTGQTTFTFEYINKRK